MSHEVESMAYANEVPWHGLGAKIEGNVLSKKFLKAAGLDWEVRKMPLVAIDEETDEAHAVPGRFGLIRSGDNRCLTVTGASWKPLQNKEVLGFMDDYVRAGGATLETAGSLRDGKIVWGLAKLKYDFEVTRGDKVGGYLLFTSPHEVGKAITIRTTTVRVVCANTMALANRPGMGSTEYRQSHLQEFNVDEARARVAEAHEHLSWMEKGYKAMKKLKLSTQDAVDKVLIPSIAPNLIDNEDLIEARKEKGDEALPKVFRDILESVSNAPGADVGTGWGVLNGVTHYYDHVHGRNNATRMHVSWVGPGATNKQRVSDRLLELAGA